MKEINFYQIDDFLAKSMAPLLLKVLEEEKNALIFSSDLEKIKEVDTGLWQFSKTKFVPHATIFEKDVDLMRQPVLISNKEENLNKSQYLILVDDSSKEFLEKFSRIFYFYDSMMIDKVKSFKKKLDLSAKIKSYKKISGKWSEFEI